MSTAKIRGYLPVEAISKHFNNNSNIIIVIDDSKQATEKVAEFLGK